jgi:hypothetical protein
LLEPFVLIVLLAITGHSPPPNLEMARDLGPVVRPR